ncbi:hypothetical protein [Actinoplanes sp. NPDC049802]|uniref:hypothetical protein n=1 Tax=Actinoplanes sp. NPDC049802 TaxID=3154742 RepID=UPI0033CC2018
MNGVTAGAIIGAALLAAVLVVTVVMRRRRARQVPDRDEILRRARAASGRIARGNRRTGRGSMRGGGLGEGTEPHQSTYGSDSGGTP